MPCDVTAVKLSRLEEAIPDRFLGEKNGWGVGGLAGAALPCSSSSAPCSRRRTFLPYLADTPAAVAAVIASSMHWPASSRAASRSRLLLCFRESSSHMARAMAVSSPVRAQSLQIASCQALCQAHIRQGCCVYDHTTIAEPAVMSCSVSRYLLRLGC